MQRAGRLLDLQQIDIEIDRVVALIASIDERLGETERLRTAREAVVLLEAARKGHESRRKDIDAEVAKARDELQRDRSRLYGGRALPPKETETLEKKVDSVRRRLVGLEDDELAVMEQIEESDAAITGATEELHRVEAEWRADQADLRAQREDAIRHQGVLAGQREGALARVDPADLPTYEMMRRTHAGRPIARIERGTCGGCRITLPSTEVQRARTSPTMVRCSSCGRYLFGG